MNTPSETFYNICSSCEYNGHFLALDGMIALIEEHDNEYSVRVPEMGVRFTTAEVEEITPVVDSHIFAKVKVRNNLYEVSILQPLHLALANFQN